MGMTLDDKTRILLEVSDERDRQDAGKFGKAVNRGYSLGRWLRVLAEEFGEAAKEINHVDESETDFERLKHWRKLRVELIQTAAVAAAFVEALDANELDSSHIDAVMRYGTGFPAKPSSVEAVE